MLAARSSPNELIPEKLSGWLKLESIKEHSVINEVLRRQGRSHLRPDKKDCRNKKRQINGD
jgi:hypothetical protein